MNLKVNRSIISASISVILAAGVMGGPAYADDVKLKATNTNVAFADFTPKEYSTKNKPNIIVLTMDDLGYGQLLLIRPPLTLSRWKIGTLLIPTK